MERRAWVGMGRGGVDVGPYRRQHGVGNHGRDLVPRQGQLQAIFPRRRPPRRLVQGRHGMWGFGCVGMGMRGVACAWVWVWHVWGGTARTSSSNFLANAIAEGQQRPLRWEMSKANLRSGWRKHAQGRGGGGAEREDVKGRWCQRPSCGNGGGLAGAWRGPSLGGGGGHCRVFSSPKPRLRTHRRCKERKEPGGVLERRSFLVVKAKAKAKENSWHIVSSIAFCSGRPWARRSRFYFNCTPGLVVYIK